MDIFKGTGKDNRLFVENCWYVAAWDYEIPKGTLYPITIANEPIVLYRKENNDLVALANQCCHRLAPLSKGRLEGDNLRCMYHGLKFDPDGKCIEIPGQDKIGDSFRVKSYPVVERHSWVWLWIGDYAASRPELIPSVTGLDDPAWCLKSGSLDYAANYLLINDNLLDLSHVAFTHRNTFAGGTDATSRYPAKVALLERGVNVLRWSPDQDLGKYIPSRAGTLCDEYLYYDFLTPGIFLMYIGIFEAGTAARSGFGRPPEGDEAIHAQFTSQAVTGMTDASSRYFFSIGPRSIEHERDPGLVEGIWDLSCRAFTEDKEIIEAQQASILANPDTPTHSIIHDRGPMMMRRLMDNLMKQQ